VLYLARAGGPRRADTDRLHPLKRVLPAGRRKSDSGRCGDPGAQADQDRTPRQNAARPWRETSAERHISTRSIGKYRDDVELHVPRPEMTIPTVDPEEVPSSIDPRSLARTSQNGTPYGV